MTHTTESLAARFVGYVEKRLHSDPGLKGVLRNARHRPWEAQSLVAPFDRDGGWMDEAVLLAGAGWVARFGPSRSGLSLGQACALAAADGTASRRSLERRLLSLCRSTPEAVIEQVPRLLEMLGVHRPDWAQLLDDLARWEKSRDRVANSWLRAFYRTAPTTQLNPTTA